MKTKNLSKSVTTFLPPPSLLLISAIALTVSACGGGGGGGAGSPTILTPEQRISRFFEGVLENAKPNIRAEIQSAEANTASINSNNIIRTSGYDGLNDRSTVLSLTTEEDSISFGLTNDGYSVATITSDADTPTGKVPGENDFTAYYLSESHDGTDDSNTAPLIVEALVYTDRTAANTDYSTFGYWLVSSRVNFLPAETEIAVFSSGGAALTPVTYLYPTVGTTATYKGKAVGLVRKAPQSLITGNSFVGDVELSASFFPTPLVDDGFSNFSFVGGKVIDIITDAGEDIVDIELPNAILGAVLAEPRSDVIGGGFSRTQLGEIEWEAHFYGDEAEVISGSFARVETASSAIFVGAFGARKETPTE